MDLIKKFKSHSMKCGNLYTHTSMFPKKGSYHISFDKLDDMLNIYCEYINKSKIGLTEKIDGACPLITDVDLKTKYIEDIHPLYNIDDIKNIVKLYHNFLKNFFKNELTDKEYICILLEKEPYVDDSGQYIKNGFHLHFPYLFLSVNDIENHIFPVIKDEINKYFNQDVFDSGIIKSPWLMYGSSKSVHKDPYLISKIFDKNCNELTILEALHNYKCYNYKKEVIQLNDENEIVYNLPRILSVIPHGRNVREVPLKVMESVRVQKIISDLKNYEMEEHCNSPKSEMYYSQQINEVKKILNLLSDKRSENHNQWIQIGWSIFNICGPSKESLQLWIDFSKRCPYKYQTTHNDHRCITEWKRMKFGNITLGTLCYFASEDNPRKYSQYRYELTREKVHLGLSGTHYDIAKIIYEDYKDIFKCTCIKGGGWYVFDGHVWKYTDEGVTLSKKISTEIVARFEKMSSVLTAQRIETDDDSNKDLIEARIKKCEKVIHMLKTHSFKVSVMKECSELFYDEHFINKLDTNPDIIAFSNGIYDLKTHIFRPGQPDDYLSKSMHIEYKEFDKFDPRYIYVEEYLEKMFPDRSLREYFLDLNCNIFKGGNHDKIVAVWTGDGDNGKSKLEEIFEKMLGVYSQKLPTSAVCASKRTQSSSATPELARCSGTRLLVVQEPSKEEAIHVGILKELSGNDTFYSRDLFQKGKDVKEITPMFKLVIVCNDTPNIHNADKAVWNRMRVIPFESNFLEYKDIPELPEEQLQQKKFLKDKDFDKKIPFMLEPLAFLLLQRFKKTGGIVKETPSKVLAATNAYKSKNDIMQQFMDENVEKYPSGLILISDIYDIYKQWFDNSGLVKSMKLSKADFKDKFSAILKIPYNFGWSGYRIKLNDEILL